MTTEPRIDAEFRDLLPTLSDEEYENLEESLLADPSNIVIDTWHGLVIDGHHRLSICRKHNLPYTIREREFANRDEAVIWILKNQLGRRNLTDAQRKLALGRLARRHPGRPVAGAITNQQVAEAHDVSVATVKRAARFADAVEQATPEIQRGIRDGQIKATTKQVEAYNNLPPEKKGAVAQAARKAGSLGKALEKTERETAGKTDGIKLPDAEIEQHWMALIRLTDRRRKDMGDGAMGQEMNRLINIAYRHWLEWRKSGAA